MTSSRTAESVSFHGGWYFKFWSFFKMFRIAIVLAIFVSSIPAVDAAVMISVQNATLTAGGLGSVDVYITGQAADTLGRFGYEFNIAGATAQSGDLQFRAIQLNTEQSETGPPEYVFLGDADAGSFNSTLGSGGLDPITLVGGDTLASLDNVPINGTFLLARLELQHFGTLNGLSHNFQISLSPLSPFTAFDRDWDAGTDTNYTSAEISSFSGTVTVNSASVPEPSSALLLALTCVGIVGRRRAKALFANLAIHASQS